jgi:hypothetical protein
MVSRYTHFRALLLDNTPPHSDNPCDFNGSASMLPKNRRLIWFPHNIPSFSSFRDTPCRRRALLVSLQEVVAVLLSAQLLRKVYTAWFEFSREKLSQISGSKTVRLTVASA